MNLMFFPLGAELFIPIIAVGGFFAALITFIYMHYRTRHIQNMALIETGQDSGMLERRMNEQGGSGLKTGLLLIGLGLGFLIGFMLANANGWDEPAGVIPMAMVGGGIGLVVNHLIASRKHEQSI